MILPVYNAGPYLRPAVLSVVNQTFDGWELLVIDDASTDGALESIADVVDPRIRRIRNQKNIGLAATLNVGVKLVRGRFIARMDQDDVSHPDRLARQAGFLEDHPEVDLLATACVTMDEREQINGTLPSPVDHAEICKRPWRGFYLAHPSWMGRSEWFRRNPYAEPAPYLCEDQELLLRAHESSHYHTLPEYLLAYRIRSHTPLGKLRRTRVAMLKMQQSYFIPRKQWMNAALSVLATAGRIGRDGWDELRYRLSLPVRARGFMPSMQNCRDWEALIDALRTPATRPSGAEMQDGQC